MPVEKPKRQILRSPPRCSNLTQVKARAFRAPPSFSDFWGQQPCWPLSAKAVARAAHPNGHAGARRRWQRVAEKLLNDEPVSIVVFGGSMTVGTDSLGPWSERLQKLFSEMGWPQVTVTNLAVAGTLSERVIQVLGENQELVREADLFIMDYSVNDDFMLYTSPGWFSMYKRHYEEVLAVLISFPQEPAVLNIETISRYGVDRTLCDAKVETEGMHWNAILDLEVPTISYSKAVCDCHRSFWMHRDSEADADTLGPDFNNWHHPGPITHELVAQLIFASFTLEMEGVCKTGITGLDHKESNATVSERTKCLTNPKTHLSASSGSEADFHPATNLGGAWEFREDVPGKPGWIAAENSGHRGGELVFNVDISSHGWLRVDYLASYEGFGDATVWLDTESPTMGNECRLQSLWSSHSSQSKAATMKLSFAEFVGTNHTLHIRSEQGAKFKLLGIMSC